MPQPDPTLFDRIARHPVEIDRNPREDRLTEVVAAILESRYCRGLARHVALAWLREAEEQHRETSEGRHFGRLLDRLADEAPDWSCQVDTQVRLRGIDNRSRRPDLEMTFTHAGAETLRLRIEVKHGSSPHSNQLPAYLGEQVGAEAPAVLLLAPRRDYAWFREEEIPKEVARIRWEDTARVISDWQTSDPVARFLVEELMSYLEEENLVDPSEITPEHLEALLQHERALDALDRLCELAGEGVDKRWNNCEEAGHWPPARPIRERWCAYSALRRAGPPTEDVLPEQGGWGLGWQIIYDSDYLFDDARPCPCFAAGMTGEAGAIRRLTEDQRRRLRDAGFELLSTDDTLSSEWEYVWRVAALNETLTGGPLEEQSQLLSGWVVQAFDALVEALGQKA